MSKYNIRKIQEYMLIISMLCLAAAGIISVLKDQKLQENTSKAYNKCKTVAPTKVYRKNNTNYVMFGSEQYNVTDESYINFTENKKCNKQ